MPRAFPEAMQLPKIGEKNEKQLKHSNAFLIGEMRNTPSCPSSLFQKMSTAIAYHYSTSRFPSSPTSLVFFSYWPLAEIFFVLHSLNVHKWSPDVHRLEAVITEDLLMPLPRHSPQKVGGFSLIQIIFSPAHDQSTEILLFFFTLKQPYWLKNKFIFPSSSKSK